MADKNIEDILYEGYKTVTKMDKEIDSIKLELASVKTDVSKDLCAYNEAIQKLTGIVQKIQKLMADCVGVVQMTAEYVKYYLTEIILKKFQINLLRLKKITLEIKLSIAKMYKKMLVGCASGKGTTMTPVVVVPLAQYQATAIAVNIILTVITSLLACIIPLIAVEAQGISFFMTPKSMMSTQLNILNPNLQNMDHLMEPVKVAIDQILDRVRDANDVKKLANIAKAVAACQKVLQAGGAVLSNIKFCPELTKIDSNLIFKLIRLIINLQITPEPVPRYEDLHLAHLSFLTWLITGFEPAGHQTFGMPGFP